MAMMIYFQNLLNTNESNPDKLLNGLLNAVAKDYTTQRKSLFANDEFIKNLITFHHQYSYQSGEKFSRNCILVIRHVCQMYQFYPNNAFNFDLDYQTNEVVLGAETLKAIEQGRADYQAGKLERLLSDNVSL